LPLKPSHRFNKLSILPDLADYAHCFSQGRSARGT
jgi:hypothetical protein